MLESDGGGGFKSELLCDRDALPRARPGRKMLTGRSTMQCRAVRAADHLTAVQSRIDRLAMGVSRPLRQTNTRSAEARICHVGSVQWHMAATGEFTAEAAPYPARGRGCIRSVLTLKQRLSLWFARTYEAARGDPCFAERAFERRPRPARNLRCSSEYASRTISSDMVKRRRAAGKSRHRQIETAPEDMHGAALRA